MSGMTDLADEYRPSMTLEVLHSWAVEVVARLRGEAVRDSLHDVGHGTPVHRMQLTKLAQAKLDELDDRGYTVNGVAIYNAETNIRGLVDRLGYVGWVTPASNPAAPAPVAGDAVRKLPAKWRSEAEARDEDGIYWQGHSQRMHMQSAADELDAALAQDRASQAGAAGVPEGWRLVPVEPTREMLDAYVSVSQPFHSARDDWAAMLAAAPAPAAEGEVRNVG